MEFLAKIASALLYFLIVLTYYIVVGVGLVLGGYLATALVDAIAGTNYRERFSNWLEEQRSKRELARAQRQQKIEVQETWTQA